MVGFTHLTFALFLEGDSSILNLALTGVGSLFPDIDSASSRFSKHKGNYLKHRGILHAPIIYVVIFALYYAIFKDFAIFPFLVGAFSHLFLDALTVSGIPLLYPFSKRKIHLLNFTTGSSVDYALSLFFLFFFILRLLKAF